MNKAHGIKLPNSGRRTSLLFFSPICMYIYVERARSYQIAEFLFTKEFHGTERNKTVQLEENFGGFVVPRF